MTLVRDDQQVFVRHFLRNPHMLSVDAESHQLQSQQLVPALGTGTGTEQGQGQGQGQGQLPGYMFQCGWRVPADAFTELSHTGVAKFYGAFLPVGLFHMNNRQSEPLYRALAAMYRSLHAACFAGRVGSALLHALHLTVDGEGERARVVLAEVAGSGGGGDGVGLLSPMEQACSDSIGRGLGLPPLPGSVTQLEQTDGQMDRWTDGWMVSE